MCTATQSATASPASRKTFRSTCTSRLPDCGYGFGSLRKVTDRTADPSSEGNRCHPDVSRHGVSVIQRCRRREIPREADELSLDAGHGRHGSRRIQGERGARVVGTYRSCRASDRMSGDDVIWVVMGKHHPLDLAADKPGPEHRRCVDAAKAQRSSVPPHGQFEIRVQPRATRWKASPIPMIPSSNEPTSTTAPESTRTPRNGRSITPTVGTPSSSRPSITPHNGDPVTYWIVPSSGSATQRLPESRGAT